MSNLIHPRLIALDLDGTLLDRQGAVTPRTRQAIADAVATLSPPTEPQSGTSARTP